MKKYFIIYLALAAVVATSLLSCNKEDKNSTTDVDKYDVYSSVSTLVSNFALKDNSKILDNLSGVKFSIDQERGLIYNADSLPKGTRVSGLCVSVTCASSVSARQFIVKNGTVQGDTTIIYKSPTTDSIDFTGDVTLRIVSYDGSNVRDYKVFVNVHKQDPDTIKWDANRRHDLPNVVGTVQASKTVVKDDKFLCLIQDNSSYVLNSIDTLMNDDWVMKELSLPFTPQVNSFAATTQAIYLLDSNGELFESGDNGTTWNDCGVAWRTIIGGYSSRLLGVMQDGSTFAHDEFPRRPSFVPTPIDDDFPVASMSQLVMASNEWTSSQQAMFAGGVTADGDLTNAVWGYDGKRWGLISLMGDNKVLPNLRDAMLVKYHTYTVSTTDYSMHKNITWMVMGGVLEDGEINTTTYTSSDQGIHWQKGESGLQQPAYMPAVYGAQMFTVGHLINTSGTILRAYNPGHITPVTQWYSPYLYLFGGYGTGGTALNSVWEGVLLGLTHRPVY